MLIKLFFHDMAAPQALVSEIAHSTRCAIKETNSERFKTTK
jgi:hypothetical protein